MPSSNVHIDQSHDVHTFCSILTIQKINSDYDGKFKVVIKNDLGEAVSTTQVNVKRGVYTRKNEKLRIINYHSISACLAVQLHTPSKTTNVGKTSTHPINEYVIVMLLLRSTSKRIHKCLIDIYTYTSIELYYHVLFISYKYFCNRICRLLNPIFIISFIVLLKHEILSKAIIRKKTKLNISLCNKTTLLLIS